MILPRRTNHSTPGSGGPSRTPLIFIVMCALYIASIIMGAGVLGLPTLTATVGWLPAVAMTIGLGVALTFIYARIAAAIRASVEARVAAAYSAAAPALRRAGVGPNGIPTLSRNLAPYFADRKGVGIIDATCTWLGFGRAGTSAMTVGLVAYVVPAIVLYIVSGGTAIAAIADRLGSAAVPVPLVASAAAVGLGVSFWAPRRRLMGRAACSFIQMVTCWVGGIAILMVVPSWRPLPLLLFAAAVAGFIVRSGWEGGNDEALESERSILPAHRIGATIAVLNLTLLSVTATLALWVLWRHNNLASPARIAPGLSFGGLAKALGVLLFAFTGTGIFNLIKYQRLFERDDHTGRTGLGKVVALGTVIPTVAYAGWMLATAFMLAPAVLVQVDNDGAYATVPLAAQLSQYGTGGWIVFITGYAVALLAVSGAASGFSESLADRLARIHAVWRAQQQGQAADISDRVEPKRVRRMQLGVLAVGTALGIGLRMAGDAFAFRDILSAAGYAGGGMLLLVLPFFIPTGGRPRPPKRDVAVATVIAASLAALNLLELPSGFGESTAGTIAGSVVIAIDVAFVLSYVWLVVSEPQPDAASALATSDRPEDPGRPSTLAAT